MDSAPSINYDRSDGTERIIMPKICRVLIVEDNHEIQSLLKELFLDEGFRLAVASDAAEMRRVIATGDVDVAIIDVMLPGQTTGIQLAHEAAGQGCGVILVTGHPSHFETVQQSGHRYLHKPFRIPSLLQLVDDVLRETKAKCKVKRRRAPAGSSPRLAG